jgi:hypothetical protein
MFHQLHRLGFLGVLVKSPDGHRGALGRLGINRDSSCCKISDGLMGCYGGLIIRLVINGRVL